MKSVAKPWFFLSFLSFSALALGFWWGERQGLLFSFGAVMCINIFVYFYGDLRLKKILAGKPFRGQDAWKIEEVVTTLANQARIPRPKVVILPFDTPTALATGRNWYTSTIYLSEGLLNSLTKEEIRAIIALEICRIKRLDTLANGISSGLSSLIGALPQAVDRLFLRSPLSERNGAAYLLQSWTSWLSALPIQLTVTQSNYLATDSMAAKLIGQPQALASALWKLHSYAGCKPLDVPPSTAHMFVVNPLTSKPFYRYFQKHPPIETRIEKLVGYFPI